MLYPSFNSLLVPLNDLEVIVPSASNPIFGWVASVKQAKIFPSVETTAAANSEYILTEPSFSSVGLVELDASELAATPNVNSSAVLNVVNCSSLQALTIASTKLVIWIEQEANNVSSAATI